MAGLDPQKGKKSTFIMLPNYMYASEAWRSLSIKSQALWLMITHRYNGFNNGEIPLSCREVAGALHISKDTASKAFTELEEKGFVKVAKEASFDMKSGRRARRWTLTHLPLEEKRVGTNDWRKWKAK